MGSNLAMLISEAQLNIFPLNQFVILYIPVYSYGKCPTSKLTLVVVSNGSNYALTKGIFKDEHLFFKLILEWLQTVNTSTSLGLENLTLYLFPS